MQSKPLLSRRAALQLLGVSAVGAVVASASGVVASSASVANATSVPECAADVIGGS